MGEIPIALGKAALGVSLSLGAFLAGMVVSESRHRTHAFAEILPLQILFSAAFFVSVGMLLDAQFLLDEPLTVLGCVVGIVAIKSLTGTVAMAVVGTGVPVALGAGLMLAQVGEFSFVLDQVGHDAGLSALDMGGDGSQALIAATVILMIATPGLAAVGNRLQTRMDGLDVMAERASHIGLEIAIRSATGTTTGAMPLSTVIDFHPDPDTKCHHLSQLQVVQPSAYGCEDCLRINATWVRLRICLACAHVGCCDTSQYKHARTHAGVAAHPLMASLEPGDDWAYCFLDDETIASAKATQKR